MAVADDWVVRTAGEVRAEAERRHPGEVPTCASGISPSGPDPPGQPARADDPAPGRGRDPPQGVPRAAPAVLGRLRPATAGSRPGSTRVLGRAHRPAADRGARPLRQRARELGRALQGAAARVAGRARRRWSPRSARPRCTPPAPTASRSCSPCGAGPTSTRCWPGTRPRGQHEAADPDDDDSAATRAPAAGTTRTSRTAPPAGATTPRSPAYDDETTELTYTCACGSRSGPVPDRRGTTGQAGLEGRLADALGLRGRRLRARRRRPLLARLVSFTVGGRARDGDLRRRDAAAVRCTPSSASPGMAKMSSSAGGAPTPADALEIMEAPLLRWLYARRRPNQSFNIAFDQEIHRLYDEWDALSRKVADGTADARRAPCTAARPGPPRARCRSRRGRCRTGRWPRSPTSPPATRPRPCASCRT